MARALELTGKKFGKLTVIERIENDKHGKSRWVCQCECGNRTTSNGSDLNRGKAQSCGCVREVHGLSGHRLYNIFNMMEERCYNPNSTSYPWYGGMGVGIHQEWLDDYTKFHEWALESGYEDNLEIDRIDPSKDYAPKNCRWATRTEQTRNSRPQRRSESGVRGVKWNEARKKWEVSITANKKRRYLGLYEDLQEAAEVRKKAEEKYW